MAIIINSYKDVNTLVDIKELKEKYSNKDMTFDNIQELFYDRKLSINDYIYFIEEHSKNDNPLLTIQFVDVIKKSLEHKLAKL